MVASARKSKQPLISLDKKMARVAAIGISTLFVFFQILILFYVFFLEKSIGESIVREMSTASIIASFISNSFLLYIFFSIEFWVLRRYAGNRKKIAFIFLGMIVFVGVLSSVSTQIIGIWFRGELSPHAYLIINFAKDLFLYLVSLFFTLFFSLVVKNQRSMEENKNLIIDNIRNRYNALKSQTEPHFLFNSLNSLNGLIGYDDERAREYVIQLSSVFRYTMQEQSVVKVIDEMEFTESYIYLIKIRYQDALTVNIRVAPDFHGYYTLPFAIQTLIENAVKHNVINANKPLHLTIETTDEETLVVSNNIQPKLDVESVGGLGLANLNERYELVFKRNITIHADDARFRVEIPLVKKTNKQLAKFKEEID